MPAPPVPGQAEASEREETIKGILTLFCAWAGKEPPVGMELKIKVAAWRIALTDVPTRDLMPVAEAELQHRTNSFFPTPADLLKRWKGEEFIIGEDGKPERVTRANTAAYVPWQPSIVPALPEGEDGPGREKWKALGERLPQMLREERAASAEARLMPTNEKALGAALYEWLYMETWKLPRDEWVGFGAWLLARYPVEQWTLELGQEQWKVWQSEKAHALKQVTTP